MTLTFDLYLTLTLSLTFDLDDLEEIHFFRNYFILFEVTWRKNVTSYVKTDGRIQKRHSIRNVLQPTRSLYHFRFKSYGPLCDFQLHILKSRDVKTMTSYVKVGVSLAEAEFYKERFATNQKSLLLPVQKLWPIMWFSQKWWPWPWLLSDFKKNNFGRFLN